MKKFLLLMLLCTSAAGCVDDDYDLSKVESGDATIGDVNSEFRMPLFVVHIDKAGLQSADVDIEALCKEADVWLPTELPWDADYVDLQRLLTDKAYLDTMLDGLIAEMSASDKKLDEVATLVYNDYRNNITIPGTESVSLADYKPLFKDAFSDPLTAATVKAEIADLAENYLSTLDVDNLEYHIDSIDLGDEVIDMLADNLDPGAKPGEPGTLCIYGTLESTLPVELGLEVDFLPTAVTINIDVKRGGNVIPETMISAEDIRNIVNGINIVIPVTMNRYYPGHAFAEGDQLRINLSLVKRGGLTLNL